MLNINPKVSLATLKSSIIGFSKPNCSSYDNHQSQGTPDANFPNNPPTMPDNPYMSLASMGIYVFDADFIWWKMSVLVPFCKLCYGLRRTVCRPFY